MLNTKFYIPPAKPQWVARPRLVERLDAGLTRRLTLVSAPAGFGKSSLLAEWLQQGAVARSRVGWLSLDAADNDPVRFWQYVVTALQAGWLGRETAPEAGDALFADLLEQLVGDASPALTAILERLINRIALLPGGMVLVLDDYHVIKAAEIHASLVYLLERQPANLHLVVATRSDPPFPLPRWRVREQLTEIRAADLCFTCSEIAAFVRQAVHLELSSGDLGALEARTEGWAAGLQMAALAMQGLARQDGQQSGRLERFIHDFTGSQRYIMEYLTEEVLDRQTEAQRAFLLHTAVLERLCGPLCDAVLDAPDGSGQAMLAALERANLFLIPLDDQGYWYRYHHLFAELLGNRLRQDVPAQMIEGFHDRASRWYEQHALPDEAIQHAIQAHNFERAAALAETVAQATFFQGRMAILARWIGALPPELLRLRPQLRLYQSWVQFTDGQMALSTQTLRETLQMLQELPATAANHALRDELAVLLARNAAMMAALSQDAPDEGLRSLEALADQTAHDDVAHSRVLAGLAMTHTYLGHPEKAWPAFERARRLALNSGNLNLATSTLFMQASALLYYGRLQQAAQYYRQVIEVAQLPSTTPERAHSGEPLPVAGIGLIGLAGVAVEQNDLDVAAAHLERGMALCQRGGLATNLCMGYIFQARLSLVRQDLSGARQALQRAGQAYRLEQLPPLFLLFAGQQIQLQYLSGEGIPVEQWVIRLENLLPAGGDGLLHAIRQLTLGRLYLCSGDAGRALPVIEALLPRVKTAGCLLPETYWYQALALAQLSRNEDALAALEQSLLHSGREGYVWLYGEQGEAAKALLLLLARHGRLPLSLRGGVYHLLNALGWDVELPAGMASLAEPLSRRELEILGLIEAGCSNQEIAARLVLSLYTVKKHISNIFGKLGVTSRTQVVMRARQLGLLPAGEKDR